MLVTSSLRIYTFVSNTLPPIAAPPTLLTAAHPEFSKAKNHRQRRFHKTEYSNNSGISPSFGSAINDAGAHAIFNLNKINYF